MKPDSSGGGTLCQEMLRQKNGTRQSLPWSKRNTNPLKDFHGVFDFCQGLRGHGRGSLSSGFHDLFNLTRMSG